MPARVSERSSRSTAKRSRPRTSDTYDEIPDEGQSTTLRNRICSIFGEVQKSNTGHRKLNVGLRKIQEACCYEPSDAQRLPTTEDFDESDFNAEIVRCLLRVLTVKKSEPAGDRIVRFLGVFLKQATESDNAIFAQDDSEELQGLPETPSSRLTADIISTLLPLLQAKDKVVRFRSTQIIAHLINTLDSVDDELYNYIRLGLLKRLRDKESNIRVQAVCGLGRLAGDAEDNMDGDDSDDDTAGAVLDKLLDVLQHDSSPEVRKSLLLNLPFTPTTLPFLLERARDLDAGIRRALYARLLPALGDFRHLSLTHREKLLRWGLRDRDDNVRKATGRLFRERWIEDCARPCDENGDPVEMTAGQLADPSLEALTELLERIDVVNAGNDDGIAIEAMKEFWDGRPDYREHIVFSEEYWKHLTPESIFVARSFNDYCRQDGIPDSLTEKLPEVTRIAYLLQSNINALAELIQRIAVEEDAAEDSVHQEFIVEQLLHLSLTLDYSDEVGRRTMFGLMREALTLPELPEEATRLVVEILKMSCGTGLSTEREFCSIVLEAIAEVHDTIVVDQPANTEDSFVSARSEVSGDSLEGGEKHEERDEEKAVKEIMVNMKCLHIAQCMLQNVESNLETNSDLVTMLNNLVVPAVRSQDAPIRERGLICLGLCCLLDKNLAEENLTLFLHCFSKGHEQLQVIAIQIIGDILAAHPSLLFDSAGPEAESNNPPERANALDKPLHKLFSKSLKSGTHPVQSTACAALSKLMLAVPAASETSNSSILRIGELLKLLVIAYFDPATLSNAALRQALSYFLPVYCHSRKENMKSMSSIALEVLHWYLSLKEELDVDGEDEADSELVSLAVVINHLVDWTDGRKLALAKSSITLEESKVETGPHLELAERILDRLLGPSTREERKVYFSLLGKLHIDSGNLDHDTVTTVLRLVQDALEDKVANDATSRNTLTKLQSTLSKAVDDQIRSHSMEATQASSVATPTAPSPAGDLQSAQVSEDDNSISIAETTEAMNGLDIQSTISTPATSPRKRRSKPTPSQRSQNVKPVYEDPEEEDKGSASMSSTTTPSASPTKSVKPRRTTTTDVEHDNVLGQENIPPPPEAARSSSPQKKPRGRPRKTQPSEQLVLDVSPGTVDTVRGEDDKPVANHAQGDNGPEPAARPSKTAGVRTSQPRKSVRASRTKTSTGVE